MICVSIAQTSHRFAFVDMLNASILADMIEIRLDRFDKAPDVKQLHESCPKPSIISCRRTQDGGTWSRSEDARMTLLRQAVLEGADYVEFELDVADQMRRYGNTKRIISYTNLTEVPRDLDDIYKECCEQDPDIVKLTVPARTTEEAWPIVKIIAKGKVPTVAVGLGRNNLMLNILGQRYNSPWIHAALEKGMEAHPGMATISELQDVYDYDHIDSKTPLIGVAGLHDQNGMVVRVLNHCLRLAESKTRCLPLEIGNPELFAKIAKALKLGAVVVDDAHRDQMPVTLTDPEEAVTASGSTDFIAVKGDKWYGFNMVGRAVVQSMEEAARAKNNEELPLKGRSYMVIGCSGTGRSIAVGILKRGGGVIMADKDNDRSQRVANELGTRYVPAGQVYTTVCDGIVVLPNDKDPKPGVGAVEIPKSMAREGLLVVDLTNIPFMTPLLDEGKYLGGTIVKPSHVFVRIMQNILKVATGKAYKAADVLQPLADFDLDSVPE